MLWSQGELSYKNASAQIYLLYKKNLIIKYGFVKGEACLL